jgi:hypothetical protein
MYQAIKGIQFTACDKLAPIYCIKVALKSVITPVQKTFIISARGPSAGGLRASDVQMKSKRAGMMKRLTK